MVDNHHSDPSLTRVREALAAGDMRAVREGLMTLTAAGRKELEQRLGERAVTRMFQNARRVRRGPGGRVVVIHGIMGGKLATRDKSADVDLVWVNYPRLVRGRIGDFRLDANGNQANSNLDILTHGLLDEYLPLVVELDGPWKVLPFAFDWRLDIDQSALALNEAIEKWGGMEPTHIVAHSMGGLVSRRFIQLHPETWAAMADPNGLKRGGRLIMLGTPNRGSFAIPFVLTGEEKTVRILERFDLAHDMAELLGIINTFVGSYQMMPSPRRDFGDDRLKLFVQQNWGPFPVVQANLDRGRRFQEALDTVTDAARLVYVAGYDQATPFRVRVDGPGDFSYQETRDGDGRVPHELGILPEVRTFFVREKHGDLPGNERVLASIHELLLQGATNKLEQRVPVGRRGLRSSDWRKAREIAPVPPAINALVGTGAGTGRRRTLPKLSAEQQTMVETEMMDTFLGGARRTPPTEVTGVQAKPVKSAGKKPKPAQLDLEVMWGDIRFADGEIFAAGHYQGVIPQNGEWALDLVVSGKTEEEAKNGAPLVITSLTKRGMIRGALGDVNFFPWAGAGHRRRTVAIAGMGHVGTFGKPELRRLSRSLTESVTALPGVQTINMLLIGGGAGNLPIPMALEALLNGLIDALGAGVQRSAISKVRIVEIERTSAQIICDTLKGMDVRSRTNGKIDIHVASDVAVGQHGRISDDLALSVLLAAFAQDHQRGKGAARHKASLAMMRAIPKDFQLRQRCEEALQKLSSSHRDDILATAARLNFRRARPRRSASKTPARISFVQDPGGMRVAALTQTAVVPERPVGFNWALVDKLIANMRDPEDVSKIAGMASLLARFVVPRDFREYFARSESTIFEVDRKTARINWEMLGLLDEDSGPEGPIGLLGPVARQLRTSYSPPPSRAASPRARLRALVIGDPGDPKTGFSLPGARQEAIEVYRLLKERGLDVTAMIGAPGVDRDEELAGFPPADLIEVLALLNDEEPFDLLHYAGHGDFDPDAPDARAGWVFAEQLLTSREIERVDTVPALIVANACLSGLVSDARTSSSTAKAGPARGTDDLLLPGLADEFFRRGVRNYVGTAWEVNDTGAIMFAKILYENLLPKYPGGPGGTSLGEALLKARLALKDEDATFGALWAAYQHYGDPDLRLTGSNLSEAREHERSANVQKRRMA
jgi:pimeloyl-ACP methyl ester carboxylesterase